MVFRSVVCQKKNCWPHGDGNRSLTTRFKGRPLLIVGVVAVQGDFAEHISILQKLGVETRQIRLPIHLEGLDALIIPGGESTTFRRLFDLYDLTEPLSSLISSGTPTWGTCAGMIMLATRLTDHYPKPLGMMDITVTRNAYGRQVDSFEEQLIIPPLGHTPFPGVFIRAPRITDLGPHVQPIAFRNDGSPVAARQNNMLVTSFHPELTSDNRFHRFFLDGLENRDPH